MSCGVLKHEFIDLIVHEFNIHEIQAEELLIEALDSQLGLECSQLSDWELADFREDTLHYMKLLEFLPDDLWEAELDDFRVNVPHYALKEDILIERGLLGWFLESIPQNTAIVFRRRISELRELAQDKIIQGFKDALSSGGEYPFGVLCATCSEGIVEKNAAKTRATIERDRSIIDGTISDIVLIPANGNPVIIDIVHSLGLDTEKHSSYLISGIPVLVREVSWADVGELDKRFTATYSLNLPQLACLDCKDRNAQAGNQEHI